MVMMECPDTVNTLLHEFFLWQPATASKHKQEPALPPNAIKTSTSKETARLTTEPKTAIIVQDSIRPITLPKATKCA